MSQMLLLNGLNEQQLAAVTWPAKPILVLAGAGSGKTKVLTTRIAWLLSSRQADAHQILAVTFTNKAAKEMQARLSHQITTSLRNMWVGTFHGLCHKFLRLHYKDANLQASFQILDQSEQQSLIKRTLKQLELNDDQYAPRSVQNFINQQKEKGLRAKDLEAKDPHGKMLIEIYTRYEAQCERDSVVDFAELLLRCFEVLKNNPRLRAFYQQRFTHLLVDEFQDTNTLQYEWLKMFTHKDCAIFAVGDDDQSIYAFRGAQVGNMKALLKEFSIEEPIRLEQNYRSVGNILLGANALIDNNQGRLGKNLWTASGEGEKIHYYEADRDYDEVDFILEEVKQLKRSGIDLSDISILYRSNAQSRIFEQKLVQAQIPYRIYGGLRFFDRQEIKHAMAYLRLITNPDDDNALLRIINIPARKIGARSIESLQTQSMMQGTSIWQAACTSSNKAVTNFVLLIEKLRAQAETLSLAEQISLLIEDSGLMAMYENEKLEGAERLENLEELVNAALGFVPEGDLPVVIEFLAAASLESGERQAAAHEEALQLMTVHAAKGLEFAAVFVSGLEEGLFPHENSLQEHKGMEEERRLMYVAMTRARQRLFLSSAQSRVLHGRPRSCIPSRFIEEIPTELLHYVHPKNSSSHPKHAYSSYDDYSDGYSQNATSSLPIGKNVKHPKFGIGVIIQAELAGSENYSLQINFAEQGIKWIDSRFIELI